MKISKKGKIYLMLTVLIMIIIFLFSAQSAEDSAMLSDTAYENVDNMLGDGLPQIISDFISDNFRKFAHFILFMLLGLTAFGAALEQFWERFGTKLTAELTLCGCILYAMTDELHQRFVPGRSCEWRDVCIDGLGAVIGIVVLIGGNRVMKKRMTSMLMMLMLLCTTIVGCGANSDEAMPAEEAAVETVAEVASQAIADDKVADDAGQVEATDEVDTEVQADDSKPVGTGKNIDFSTVDIYGNAVTTADLQSAKLVMLNLWEPWCGPCVGELPELNKLYQDYKDRGLLIIGAYSTFEMDADALEIVESDGISYPIVKCDSVLDTLEQDYVPATYLLDSMGNLITTEPYIGSNDYSGWEEIIKEYLN